MRLTHSIISLAALLAFAPLGSFAAEEPIIFRNQRIYTEGLSAKVWVGDPSAMDAELILIYSNAAPEAVNTLRTDLSIEARMLLVGGGGAGGYGTTGSGNPGGGGGGGEVLDLENTGYSAGTYAITVGAGGAQTTAQANGENGHPSVIMNGTDEVVRALGGGGGGAKGDGNGGDDVATGGGGGGQIKSGVYGQGGVGKFFKGGNAASNNRSGGGAGAGGDGQNATTGTGAKAGDGGSGTNSTILVGFEDDARWFGGGGGGAQSSNATADYAGSGQHGGGHGGYQNTAGEDGVSGTGGGGGGGGRGKSSDKTACTGGAGGSGIVIIRITFIEQPMKWKSVDVKIKGQATDGKIFIEETAGANWLENGDLVLTFSNATTRGGLCFYDPEGRTEYLNLPPIWANARILAVGGGGGGGMINEQRVGGGGGGGAGGFLEEDVGVFSTNHEYSITVGAGGKGGTSNEEAGESGGNSSVSIKGGSLVMSDEAYGGGGGGAHSVGLPGGSGGGGSRASTRDESGSFDRAGGTGVTGQGYKGGLGGATYRGGGGGGAGGSGGDSVQDIVGAGGAGTNSTITGSEKWYAGGGGGALINANASTKTAGGDGGTGGGGNGAGAAAAQDGVNGTGGGGGGGVSYVGAPETAGNGGSGIVIIRLSGFVVNHVPRPKTADYTYDGNSHAGVEEFYAYTLSGDLVASNADVYAVTATIAEDAPYTWWDGGRGDRILHWTIRQLRVPAPAITSELVYNGAEQCPIDRDSCGLDEDGVCHAKTNNLPYCRLTPTYLATDVAEYHFTAKLIADLTSVPNVTNFVWSNDLTMKDRDYTWYITQAPNAIRDFLYPCRKLDRLIDPRDSFTSDWPKRGDMVIGDNVVVEVRPEGGGEDEWKAWGKPTEKGSYEIRITIPECTNWKGAGPVQMAFGTWEKLSDIFSDRMEVTVAGNTSGTTELKDFPVPVRVHEPETDGYSAFSGFSYGRAGATGRELRFFDVNGDPVEHEVDTWNIHGESVFWVRVPSLKNKDTKLTMCWRRVGDIRIPDYDPAGVWRKNYVGVWHFSQAEGGVYDDSTGNDRTAYLTAGAKTKEIDGKLGKALYIQNGDLLADDWPYPQGTGTNKFTFSGWYRNPDFKANTMFAGVKLGASTTAEMKTLPGWCLRMSSANNRVYWEATNAESEKNGIGWNLQTTWGMLGFGNDGAASNGSKKLFNTTKEQFTGLVSGSDKPLQIATGGFEVDEVRVSTNYLGDAWVKETYNTLYNAAYCTYGLVRIDCDRYNDGNGLICDYWTLKPSLKKNGVDCTVWREGENWPTESKGSYVATTGGGAGTAITATYRLIPDGEPTTEHPTAKGHYRATYDHSAPADYRPQPYTLDFYIIEATVPVYDIGGNGGDSGRILLMNADNRKVKVKGEGEEESEVSCGVTNQGWCAQSDTGVTYWKTLEGGAGTNNVMPGTSFELVRSADTNVLWRLYDCRQGNTFPTNDNQALTAAPWNSYCYLPASSSTALSITNEDVAATRSGTGWVLMRNVECPEEFVDEFAPPSGACVYSPCYSNGIGTIYFDAVNSRPAVASGAGKNDGGYELVLEIAAENDLGEPPFDENSYSTDGQGHTNWYGRLNKLWKPVELSAMLVNNATYTGQSATNCLALKVTGAGKVDQFYRVHARVDVHRPCRFRIRRASVDDSPAVQDADGQPDPDAGYLLLDNIIASFPPVVAELKPYGRFDPALTGLRAVGYGGAFETPFPSAAEGASLTGRCAVAYSGDYTPDEESFSLKQMFYRWRYLEQLKEPTDGDWKAMDLQEAGDELRTALPLETPAAPGDIEFYFVTILRTPYYGYVDYTGLGKPVWPAAQGGYTEEGLPHESRFESPDGGRLASGGTDWFVRLRDGRSRYEGLRLLTRPAGGGAVETNVFELVGEDQWAVKMRTRNPVAGGLDFRIEGLNPQEAGSREYALSTDCWRSDGPIGTFPSRATIGACGADEWGWFACDAATGWLYFQLDLPRLALQVAHAEAEDFSKWASAVNPSGLFVGSAVDTNSSSAVTAECEVNWSEWSASVATNGSWQENFGVSPGTVTIASYPRNVPFSTARTLRGWTAESAMWTYGKWSLQNNADATKSTGDDSAVQLRGGGLGRLSFIDAANVPDGLDTVTYRARVAQVNDFNGFTWYDWYLGTSFEDMVPTKLMQNYTVATIAALTATGAGSYDGDGSISLVGYYNRDFGCYEFRVSRGTNDKDLRLALFRWRKSGDGYVCEKLLDKAATDPTAKNYFDFNADGKNPERGAERLVKDSKTIYGGLFLSVMEDGGKTLVTAGVCETDVSTLYDPSTMSGQQFTCLTYHDNSAERLTKGTFGVQSCNCPAVFAKPLFYRAGVQSYKPSKAGFLQSATDKAITFSGDRIDGTDTDAYYTRWEKSGRLERIAGHGDGVWGFQTAPVEPQKVLVQVSDHGKSTWADVCTNTVSGFTSQTFRNAIHDGRQCDVRLQVGDSKTDARTDVVVDDVSLTQWNGQWTPNWDETRAPWYGLTNRFVYTSAWVNEKSGRKSLLLQPARARTSSTPVSLRTPLMRGLGLIHFAWRNADPRAKIRVQYKENVTEGSIVGATENLNEGTGTDDWTTFETIEVGAIGASGSYTSYLNRRYDGKDSRGRDAYFGLIRLVIDRDVEAEAMTRRRTDPDYGAVEITDAFAWDYPEFDKTGWNGWNFRAAGWDGTDPDAFANLKDAYRGLAGLLNNTLDENTLAEREKGHYSQRLPSVQSPAFRTNAVGALTFRARLFDAEDLDRTGHGAVVTVYGNGNVDDKGEPVGDWTEICDVEVSNATYAVQSVKIPATLNCKAIRLAVKGVKGVTAGGTPKYDPPLRVAIDDIVVWERLSQTIAFRKAHVRPFRDATAIKGAEAVKDIAEMAEQPLVGESFGFQAEVEVLDPDEVITDDPAYPITVDLWYYQGSDVWGYENWKTNPAVVKVTGLTPATDGNGLVFRSTVERSASLCPPQFLEEGEGYRIVQYHVVAHYFVQGHSEGEHHLTSSEWSMPEWNTGFADPNGTNAAFSAFTLLEEIAPGRAWINEVNYCEKDDAASKEDQWVEIAVPSGVDMSGWKLRLYDLRGHIADLLTFGATGPAKKPVPGGDPSHYDFYVVKSPNSKLSADATWSKFTASTVDNGKLKYSDPYGFELVRPTGVTEHSVVVQGWNQYREAGYDFAWQYDGTNLVKVLDNLQGTPGKWVWAEEDKHLFPGCTVGVVTNQGMVHVEWKSPMGRSPGTLNEGQYIDPDWYILPNGGYVKIYSTVFGGHMRQIIGGVTNTSGDLTISQGTSTSIVYEVDRWYKLGPHEVKPNERAAWSDPRMEGGKSYYTLNLNLVSNRIDITASAAVSDEVEALMDAKYPEYRPAIMKWLERGVTGNGTFRNPDGPLQPGYYRGNVPTAPLPNSESNRLDLVDMYWLDMDPTAGGWELWGGMGDKPGTGKPGLGPVNFEVIRTNGTDVTQIHTNILTTVWLELKNDEWTDDSGASSPLSYPPYRLQGLGNEQSDNPDFSGSWTSATFKVTMMLATDDRTLKSVRRPMRYFVFNGDSFRAKNDSVSPFASRIEITDPFSRQSPAWEWGWWKYADRGLKPFSCFRLNGDITPGGVSTLKKDDLLNY